MILNFKKLIILIISFLAFVYAGEIGLVNEESKLRAEPNLFSRTHSMSMSFMDTVVILNSENNFYQVLWKDYSGWVRKKKVTKIITNEELIYDEPKSDNTKSSEDQEVQELLRRLRGESKKENRTLFEQLNDNSNYNKPDVKSDNWKALVLALFVGGIAIFFLVLNFYQPKKNEEHDEKKSKSNVNYEKNDKEKKQDEQSTKDEYVSIESRYGKILGLEGNVNKKDIHKAYKQKMKEYHPDKVSNMAKELQELALKRTKEINEAYEYFKKKYRE